MKPSRTGGAITAAPARSSEPPGERQPHGGGLDGVEVAVGNTVRTLAGQTGHVIVRDLVGLGVRQVQDVERQADAVGEGVADPSSSG